MKNKKVILPLALVAVGGSLSPIINSADMVSKEQQTTESRNMRQTIMESISNVINQYNINPNTISEISCKYKYSKYSHQYVLDMDLSANNKEYDLEVNQNGNIFLKKIKTKHYANHNYQFSLIDAINKSIEQNSIDINSVIEFDSEMENKHGDIVAEVKIKTPTNRFYDKYNQYGENVSRPTTGNKPNYPTTPNQPVKSPTEIKQVVLNRLGKTESEVTFNQFYWDVKDSEYEIKVTINGTNDIYEIDVNGYNGMITKFEQKYNHHTNYPQYPNNPQQPQYPHRPQQPTSPTVSEAQAKQAVLNRLGKTESEVTFIKCYWDAKDGEYEMEVVINNDNSCYEVDVNGYNGVITKFEREYNNHTNRPQQPSQPQRPQQPQYPHRPQQPTSPTVSEAQAKQTVLNRLGKTESEVTFIKCYWDANDGEYEMKVVINNDNTCYEVDVNGYNGRITKFEREYNNHTNRPQYPNNPQQPNHPQYPPQTSTPIKTRDEIKQIVANYLKTDVNNMYFKELKFNAKKNTYKVEVRMYNGYGEYELKIDALTGNVLQCELD